MGSPILKGTYLKFRTEMLLVGRWENDEPKQKNEAVLIPRDKMTMVGAANYYFLLLYFGDQLLLPHSRWKKIHQKDLPGMESKNLN